MMLRILAVAMLGTVVGLAATAGFSQADERLVRIEAGLLPPINWRGEARVTMALLDRMAYYQAPGVSLAVLDKGMLVCARAWGVARAGGAQAVTPDMMFQAGSVSKTVAALLALHLASAGRFRVDDPVNAHLKEWKLPDSEAGSAQPVLIRHLLSHSAGLTSNTYRGVPPRLASPCHARPAPGQGGGRDPARGQSGPSGTSVRLLEQRVPRARAAPDRRVRHAVRRAGPPAPVWPARHVEQHL